MRKMRVHNPIPNVGNMGYRDMPVTNIIEDPNMRNSEHSYFIQAVDVSAFMLFQLFSPNSYIRKKTANGYFNRLKPVLNTHASKFRSDGIVIL